jgi:hypothetical protein
MTAPHPQKRPAFEPAARLLRPTGYDPDMPRPSSTTAGVVLVLLRVAAGALILVALAAGWDALVASASADVELEGFDMTRDAERYALWLVIAVGAAVLAVDALLAILIYRGHNWPRVLVMLIAVISISSAFTTWWVLDQDIKLEGTFVSLSLDILILLALSSRSAAAYARRNERRAEL